MAKKATNISVVGLGYVGLPLLLLAATKGYTATGIDINTDKIVSLEAGISYIDDVRSEDIRKSSAVYSNNMAAVSGCHIVIICVPTPVDSGKIPDLTLLKNATRSAGEHVGQGTLIVIESTINPGVCDEILVPILEESSGMRVGRDIYIAHCPERINPGDEKWNVSNINRVVGANDRQSLKKAHDFYSSVIDADILKMGSLKEAEAVKIVENSFRDINIAFVNELAMSFHTLGIDLINVIRGAATKPFSFMAHYPSIGVGGHCIPVDPYYLIEYARTQGFNHQFLSLARDINEGMPRYTYSLLDNARKNAGISDLTVTVLGLSYKPNVSDIRESPALKLLSVLEEEKYKFKTYDPYISGQSSEKTLEEALSYSSCVVLACAHNEILDKLTPAALQKSRVRVIIDGQNAMRPYIEEFKHMGILYKGIGA
jgi:nucleotide sugar dehydrogenase